MATCIAAGFAGGEAFSVGASLIKADVDKKINGATSTFAQGARSSPAVATSIRATSCTTGKNDCSTCSLKPKCTTAVVRKVTRDVHEDIRESRADRLTNTDSFEQSRRERKKVEMRFAHMKRILKLDRLRLRGLSGARDEVLLTATAQNLRRLAKLLLHAPTTIASACPA